MPTQKDEEKGHSLHLEAVYARLHGLAVQKQAGIELYLDGRRPTIWETEPADAGLGLLEVVMGYRLVAWATPEMSFQEFSRQLTGGDA